MRFLDANDYDLSPECLPLAKKVPVGMYACSYPLMQNSVRVICRSEDTAKQELLKQCFTEFIGNLQSEDEQYSNVQFDEIPQTPTRNLNDELDNMPCVSQTPLRDDDGASSLPKRQRTGNGPSLFSQVVGQK
jgi:hypothetical protein